MNLKRKGTGKKSWSLDQKKLGSYGSEKDHVGPAVAGSDKKNEKTEPPPKAENIIKKKSKTQPTITTPQTPTISIPETRTKPAQTGSETQLTQPDLSIPAPAIIPSITSEQHEPIQFIPVPVSEFDKFDKMKKTIKRQTWAIIITTSISLIALLKSCTEPQTDPSIWSAIRQNQQLYRQVEKRLNETEGQAKAVNEEAKKKLEEVQAIKQNIDAEKQITQSIEQNKPKPKKKWLFW